MLCLWNAKAIA